MQMFSFNPLSMSAALVAMTLLGLSHFHVVVQAQDQTDSLFLGEAQTGYVTTFEIPPSGIWQSFQSQLRTNLTRVQVLLGASSQGTACQKFYGVLEIYHGKGRHSRPYFSMADRMISQQIIGEECRCTSRDCVVWQTWDLSTPVALNAEEHYTLFIKETPTVVLGGHLPQRFRVGLAVADLYSRGVNHFEAPGYDFTFKTFVDSSKSDIPLVQVGSTSSTATPPQQATIDRTALYTGVGTVVLVLVVAAAVIRNRRRHSETLVYDITSSFGGSDKNKGAQTPWHKQLEDAMAPLPTAAWEPSEEAASHEVPSAWSEETEPTPAPRTRPLRKVTSEPALRPPRAAFVDMDERVFHLEKPRKAKRSRKVHAKAPRSASESEGTTLGVASGQLYNDEQPASPARVAPYLVLEGSLDNDEVDVDMDEPAVMM
eukprot:m.41549 g.41549  ORF g.41549 m.41549 type:complete len:428 (+) comp10573_c0_seq2:394-1677(+)